MNKIQLLAALTLILLSAVSFANKIVITGQPAFLEKQGDAYFLPNSYKMTKSYYYVILNGQKQVCYLEKQPTLSALNVTLVDVNFHGSTMSWTCYPFDTVYFQTP